MSDYTRCMLNRTALDKGRVASLLNTYSTALLTIQSEATVYITKNAKK